VTIGVFWLRIRCRGRTFVNTVLKFRVQRTARFLPQQLANCQLVKKGSVLLDWLCCSVQILLGGGSQWIQGVRPLLGVPGSHHESQSQWPDRQGLEYPRGPALARSSWLRPREPEPVVGPSRTRISKGPGPCSEFLAQTTRARASGRTVKD
jgi:hypothetical protein